MNYWFSFVLGRCCGLLRPVGRCCGLLRTRLCHKTNRLCDGGLGCVSVGPLVRSVPERKWNNVRKLADGSAWDCPLFPLAHSRKRLQRTYDWFCDILAWHERPRGRLGPAFWGLSPLMLAPPWLGFPLSTPGTIYMWRIVTRRFQSTGSPVIIKPRALSLKLF